MLQDQEQQFVEYWQIFHNKKNKNWSLKLMFEQIELNEESMVYHTCCGVTSQAEIKLDSLSVTAKAEFKLVYFITFTVR